MPEPFPDVEASLTQYLTAQLGVTASTETPDDLDQLAGFVRVLRGPGGDDGVTDAPVIDVEAFALTRGDARDLAEAARVALHALQGRRAGPVLYDSVRTSLAPFWLDYRNPKVHRFTASYAVQFRAY